MRAILIDPETQEIKEVECGPKDFRDILRLIGAGSFDCVRLNEQRDAIYLDDVGLQAERCYAFKLSTRRDPLAGKALVLGTDYKGDSVPPNCTVEDMKLNVEWLGEICPELTTITEMIGESEAHRIVVTYSRPKKETP